MPKKLCLKMKLFEWVALKTSLLRGLIELKIHFVKLNMKESHTIRIQKSEYNLFHSTISDGKKQFRKKLFLTLNWLTSSKMSSSKFSWLVYSKRMQCKIQARMIFTMQKVMKQYKWEYKRLPFITSSTDQSKIESGGSFA